MGSLATRVACYPERTAVAAIAAAVLIGGGAFTLAEGGTYIDGVWWAFVSLTTVGYGDLSPQSPGVRFIAMCVIATGIFAVAILTAALAGRIVMVRIDAANDTPELDDDLDEIIARLESLRPALQELHRLQQQREESHA
jgi:voltage-gated potassium channel Kch